MFKAAELVAFVLSMVGMPYWYGCCVYRCTESLRSRKAAQYPSHYGSDRTAKYREHIAAKLICADCVGLIKGFFWTDGGKGIADAIGNDKTFVNTYGKNGCPDKSANGMLSWCKSKGCENGTIDTLPEVPGVLLFSDGHVGVYVGNGWAVEERGFKYGCVKTKVKERGWKWWAYLPATLIDYSGAEIPAVTPTVYKLGERILKVTSPAMKGDDVRELQTRLNDLGFDCGTADGEFGPKTEKGVKAFQKAANVEVDGKFGPKSFAALEAYQKVPDPIPTEEPYEIHGFIPDVSVYQNKIDLDKFCAGNDFAIFRARVNGKDDTKFAGWATELKRRGFPFAVYDYVCLKSEADAIHQAEAMYAACAPYSPKIYYLDTEQLADGVNYAAEREYIKAYVKRLRELGVERIGQYTGDSRWRTQYRELEPIFDTLWIANWGSNEGSYTGWTLKSAAYTNKIHLHQFTSNGFTKVAGAPGINARVDLNRLTGVVPLSWFTGREYVNYTKYTVQKGDTMWGIAKKFLGAGAKYPEIMTLNGMTSASIRTGQVLKIPC